MALFGSGMCYGHSHGNANLPLVLAGGSDLRLKHGSHVDFNNEAPGFQGYAVGADGALSPAHYQLCSRPVNSEAHMSNLLLLMAQRMGVETDQFGDSSYTAAPPVTQSFTITAATGGATPVPALGPWGIMLAVAGLGGIMIRRRTA